MIMSWVGWGEGPCSEKQRVMGGEFPQHSHSTVRLGCPDTQRHKACLYVMLPRDPASPEWQWGAVALLWCAGVCVCVCVCVCVYVHTPVGTGAHTGVHVFRVCVYTDMHVCVHAQQHRAVLIILCEVCTPGSVRGQQGTCTLRPRTEPPDPKGH